MDIVAEVMTLKKEVADILARYSVPMDDRDYILEKLDRAVALVLDAQKNAFDSKLGEIRKEVELERDNVRKEVEGIRQSALSKLSDVHQKVDEAYEEGVSDGISQAPSSGPGSFTIILGIFFAALAVTVVAGGLFSSSGKK